MRFLGFGKRALIEETEPSGLYTDAELARMAAQIEKRRAQRRKDNAAIARNLRAWRDAEIAGLSDAPRKADHTHGIFDARGRIGQ